MQRLAVGLVARAQALDAVEARADVVSGAVRLDVLSVGAEIPGLFYEQLGRVGRLAIVLDDPGCDLRRVARALPRGVVVETERDALLETPRFFLRALADHGAGIAPLEPLRSIARTAEPAGDLQLLVGPERAPGGDVTRRTYCVRRFEKLAIERADAARPTLDPRTLDPALELRLSGPLREALRAVYRRASERTVLAAIDDEVIGPCVLVDDERVTVRVVPRARVGSTSPELVAALLRSAALPVEVQVEEVAFDETAPQR